MRPRAPHDGALIRSRNTYRLRFKTSIPHLVLTQKAW